MALPFSHIGHSRFVFLGKRVLLGLTVVLMLAVVVVSWFNQRASNGRLTLESVDAGVAVDKPVMVKPRYQGIDKRNRPFTITATAAVDEGEKVYRLNKVSADLAPESADWVGLTSEQALYHSAEERIEFSGGVNLVNNAGYMFTTDQAVLMVRDGTAKGNSVVEGTGAAGTLRADRFEIVDGGNKIMFYGNVRVTIYRKGAK